MADIVLSVPMRETHAADGNYDPGPRPQTIGIVIQATVRGERTVDNEYLSTISWLTTPDSQASAHLLVGDGKFREVCRLVHDDELASLDRELNQTRLALLICQPTPTSPISDFQYQAAAEACRLWAAKYGFPIRRVTDPAQAGVLGPPSFDWSRFMSLANPTQGGDAFDLGQVQD